METEKEYDGGGLGVGRTMTELKTIELKTIELKTGGYKPGSRKKIRAILHSLETRFPVRRSFKWGELVRSGGDCDEPVQRWFCYREGYSLALAARLLQDVLQGGLVVDPCCGTGVTLLAGRERGCSSVGIDLNPLAAFASRVKTANYSEVKRVRLTAISKRLSNLCPTDPTHEAPELRNLGRVFLPTVLHALLVIQHAITQIGEADERDFFLLAWLSLLEGVSNLKREGSLKNRRRRRLYRGGYEVLPTQVWQSSSFPADPFAYVLSTFLSRVQEMFTDLDVDNLEVTAREVLRPCSMKAPQSAVFRGSAMELGTFLAPGSADAVVFSPPYLNTLNYVNAYRIELWMGGFLRSYDERKELNRSSIRSHFDTSLVREGDSDLPEELEGLIRLMDADSLWSPDIPQMVRGYFHDMGKILEESFKVLKAGGVCRIVIGTSAYGLVVVPTDTLLAAIAETKGFTVERISVARPLGTSSQQMPNLKPFHDYLRESILFLRKG